MQKCLILDQYQIKTDKKSGITDDPNDYSTDETYIFNLLLRIINVSVQTVDLVNSLPKLEVEEQVVCLSSFLIMRKN